MNVEFVKIVGAIASVCTALAAQVDLFGPQFKTAITIVGLVAGTLFAYFKQAPDSSKNTPKV